MPVSYPAKVPLERHGSTHNPEGSDALKGYVLDNGFIHDVMSDPDCTVTYDQVTRKFTLTKGMFTDRFFLKGLEHIFNTFESTAHSDTTGRKYFVYNDAGNNPPFFEAVSQYDEDTMQIISIVDYVSAPLSSVKKDILPKIGQERFNPTTGLLDCFTINEAIKTINLRGDPDSFTHEGLPDLQGGKPGEHIHLSNEEKTKLQLSFIFSMTARRS